MRKDSIYKQVAYQELGGSGVGALIINGLTMPRNKSFDPLGKIWSTLRKRILEKYGVDVVGTFIYDDMKETISCTFCLNYGFIRDNNFVEKHYTQKFEQSFTRQMIMFEETIDAFLLDDTNGYEPYCELINKIGDDDPAAFEAMFNTFLKSINMRTKKDEKRAEREAKRNRERALREAKKAAKAASIKKPAS